MPAALWACRCCHWASRWRSTPSCRFALLPDGRAWLTARPFAHRGLHGAGISENGLAAFDAAIAAGFGIECDVRSSRDGVPILFHDATLGRMTGRTDALAVLSATMLTDVALPDGGMIAPLDHLLDRCGDGPCSTPLLIELKIDGRQDRRLCAAVAAALQSHGDGPVAVMSFNPMAVRWFARHAPTVTRGLVVTAQGKRKAGGWIERTLALWLAKPDFLACDIRDLPSSFAARARKKGLPVLTWTVRSQDEHDRASAHADQIIFEMGKDETAHD